MDNNQNKPRSREKNVTSGGSGVHRRGEGLGTGQVGAGGQGKSSGAGTKAVAGGGGIALLAIIISLLFGGGFGSDTATSNQTGSSGGSSIISSLTGQTPAGFTGGSSGSNYFASSGSPADTSVADGSRAKYTNILGNQQDTVTVMLYMCGTDLESKYGMSSSDLQEIANAKYGDNVKIIVYTGGCSGWKTSGISSSTNQIYQVVNGGLKLLVSDDGIDWKVLCGITQGAAQEQTEYIPEASARFWRLNVNRCIIGKT